MNARSHDEYKDNLGAYVLGALPELEVELLERHLAGCESCRADVEELRPVTAALARSVPQVEAPPSLKAGLMQTVNAEAAMRAGDGAPRRQPRRSFAELLGGLQPRVAAAAALAVLALGIVVGVAADKLGGSGTQSTTALVAKIDRSVLPRAGASLAVKGDRAKFQLTGAPQPPRGRVYQLWYQHGKTIERGGTFRPNANGSYEANLSVSHANAVMVTVERAGGAPAPTGPPILQFNT